MLRDLRPEDREPLLSILRATGMFSDEEILVAQELIDVGLGRIPGEGYRFVVTEQEGRVAGYACFGQTPMTDGTWDLYWIAVDPAMQGRGLGAALVHAVEDRARAAGARLLVVETAGKASYAATRAFYERIGYPEHARLRDFYRDGDDKVIHLRRL